MIQQDPGVVQMQMAAANLDFEAARERLALTQEQLRPSYIYRPRIYPDGDQWCALMGADLQEGVAGFGDSPDSAYRAFDKAWYESIR